MGLSQTEATFSVTGPSADVSQPSPSYQEVIASRLGRTLYFALLTESLHCHQMFQEHGDSTFADVKGVPNIILSSFTRHACLAR